MSEHLNSSSMNKIKLQIMKAKVMTAVKNLGESKSNSIKHDYRNYKNENHEKNSDMNDDIPSFSCSFSGSPFFILAVKEVSRS